MVAICISAAFFSFSIAWHTSESLGLGQLINIPDKGVHDQNCEGNAFVVAAEIADEHRNGTASDAEQKSAVFGDRCCGIVGCHENCTEHQTAANDLTYDELDALCRVLRK